MQLEVTSVAGSHATDIAVRAGVFDVRLTSELCPQEVDVPTVPFDVLRMSDEYVATGSVESSTVETVDFVNRSLVTALDFRKNLFILLAQNPVYWRSCDELVALARNKVELLKFRAFNVVYKMDEELPR